MSEDQHGSKFELTKVQTVVTIIGSVIASIVAATGLMKGCWHAAEGGGAKGVKLVEKRDDLYLRHLRLLCGPQKNLQSSGSALDFKIKVQKVIPYYLVNTIKNKPAYLYWAVYQATTTCPECINLNITLSSETKSLAVVEGGSFSYDSSICRLPAEESVTGNHGQTTINPDLKFMKSDVYGTLSLQWKLTAQATAYSDSVLIQVLPENVVCWDLKTPDDKQVPVEFIVASLAAWTKAKTPEIDQLATSYLDAPDQPADRWMAKCYQDLYGGRTHRMAVHPYPGIWPPASENEEIKLPQEALKARRADSVGAALLVSALHNAAFGGSQRLVLVSLPPTGSARSAFYLAWLNARGSWEAVDMTAPVDVPFDDNKQAATPSVINLIESPAVAGALDSVGVYVAKDRRTVAVDFAKAARHYGIEGAP
ncbi:hypothetical protein M1B72_06400 [Geomonas paludis]|uniref:Uncharacterized protein n=1 Tax=Geomonas paludis TaxID=2740185 RepID=A0A6V8MYM9_9BACT|nr:hypothetical protein [Geomonas paludis]UPU37331.1 hypothetical protein M1B72_06400 [Geomonas paludis]GFO65232.1 hypothetical protein GMPD_31510 [Geomonas paludis]